MEHKRVLGTRLDLVSKKEAVDLILGWTEGNAHSTRIVATAYSEFFVAAKKNRDFRMALEGSDLVTPDGIGPLAAIRYTSITKTADSLFVKLGKGLATGVAVLSGKVGEPVSGYWLFSTLVERMAARKGRIFLLGGFGDTARRLAEKLKAEYPDLLVGFDAGSQKVEKDDVAEDIRVLNVINQFKPDILFVAYGPVKQELWLAKHKMGIKAKVAMGVGGTFDEALGIVAEAPSFFTRHGLKWLWRLLQQPQRARRIFNATILFAWLVFRES